MEARSLLNQLSNWGRFTTYAYCVSLIPQFMAGMVILQTLILISPPVHR